MKRKPSQRYQEMEILTMSPPRRVVFLYAMAHTNLRKAERHLGAGEIAEQCSCLLTAQDVLMELLTSLDRDTGGQLAQNLAALYVFLINELAAINSQPNGKRLARITGMVAELHEAWAQAAELVLSGEPVGAMA